MFAGLEKSRGDYVVMMDVDLQDPPSLLPEMFEYIWQGYDSVATRRVTRKGEPPIRSFFARRFYHLMKKISQTEMMDGARDYRLMTRQMVDAILSMREYNRLTNLNNYVNLFPGTAPAQDLGGFPYQMAGI